MNELNGDDGVMLSLKDVQKSAASASRVPYLLVVEHVYHAQEGEQPVDYPTTFRLVLKDGAQAYYRARVKVPPGESVKLDTGWIEKPGMVIVQNPGPSFTSVQPTKEQVAANEAKLLKVYLQEPQMLLSTVPVGTRIVLYSPPPSVVRCEVGGHYTVVVVPE